MYVQACASPSILAAQGTGLGGRVRVRPEMSPAGVCLPACSNLFVQRDEGEGEGEGGVVCCQHQLHRRQAARDGCNLWWWRVTANQ